MLKIKVDQWFDLNILGVLLAFVIMFAVLFYNLKVYLIILLESLTCIYAYYLYKKIHGNKSSSLLINNENKWFIQIGSDRYSVDVKDFWLLTGWIFIWLKGSNKSISFVVSRSIIGAEKFSLLRSKLI
jgi:Ca2+/Na+ antiporter